MCSHTHVCEFCPQTHARDTRAPSPLQVHTPVCKKRPPGLWVNTHPPSFPLPARLGACAACKVTTVGGPARVGHAQWWNWRHSNWPRTVRVFLGYRWTGRRWRCNRRSDWMVSWGGKVARGLWTCTSRRSNLLKQYAMKLSDYHSRKINWCSTLKLTRCLLFPPEFANRTFPR